MDRKRHSIITELKTLKQEVADIKGEQMTGSDSTEIKVHQTEDTYDHDLDVPALEIGIFYSYFIYDTDDAFNRAAYNTMAFQIYYSNVGDEPVLWEGNSELFVYLARNYDSPAGFIEAQVTNTTGVTKNVKIKIFALSTARAGEFLFANFIN